MSVMEISPAKGVWVVRAGGAVLGESENALMLREGDRAPVIYFPREDIAMAFLDLSATTSHCPHKGDARHYTIHTKSRELVDAAWSYEEPLEQARAIGGHLAFYPADEVTVERL